MMMNLCTAEWNGLWQRRFSHRGLHDHLRGSRAGPQRRLGGYVTGLSRFPPMHILLGCSLEGGVSDSIDELIGGDEVRRYIPITMYRSVHLYPYLAVTQRPALARRPKMAERLEQ